MNAFWVIRQTFESRSIIPWFKCVPRKFLFGGLFLRLAVLGVVERLHMR